MLSVNKGHWERGNVSFIKTLKTCLFIISAQNWFNLVPAERPPAGQAWLKLIPGGMNVSTHAEKHTLKYKNQHQNMNEDEK